ncbi:hypothetical protein ABK040_002836 [Willaertia magna]
MGQLCCCLKCNRNDEERISILNNHNYFEQVKISNVLLENDKIDNLIGKELMECGVNKSTFQFNSLNYKFKYLTLNSIYLSEEIILLILSYLSMKDNLQLSLVNKSFKKYWTRHPLLWNNYRFKIGFYCKNIKTIQDIIYYIFKPNYLIKHSFTKVAQAENAKLLLNIVICGGDIKIGKSTWIKLFLTNTYDNKIKQTLSTDYFATYLQYYDVKKDKDIQLRLDIFDFNGNYSLFPVVERGANGLMFCFDLSNEKSFDNMELLLTNYINPTTNEAIKNEKKIICIIEREEFFYDYTTAVNKV